MIDETITLPHKLTLQERKTLTMTGVTEVISFDEDSVALSTCMGNLTVHGENLQLKNLSLDGGQVTVTGTIAALIYEDPRPERRGFGRLFR